MKDNKLLALIMINIQAVCPTFITGLFRIVAKEGFHQADFNLYRNVLALIVAIVWCLIAKVNPFKDVPRNRIKNVFGRMFFGQANFVLMTLAAPLAPISLIMVIWQTNPFWISLFAFCLFGEKIMCVEIIGIVICFSAVAVIAV